MQCIRCSAEIPDGSIFCPFCGGSAITGEATEQSISPQQAQAPVVKKKPRKKRRKLKITLSVIAAVLIVVLVAGWLTNWFGFYGPGTKILNAFKNTFQKGNFTISFTINGTQRVNCQMDIDWSRNDMTMLMTEADGSFICAIKDNYLITKKISFGKEPAYNAYNITGFLNILFRVSSGDGKGINWKSTLNSLSPGLYEELSKDIDFSKMDAGLLKLLRKTNSNQWLKKNAGFSHSKENGADIYSFQPDTYKLASATLACFEKAFKNDAKYDALQNSLSQSKGNLQALDYTVDLAVKDKLLTDINIRIADQTSVGVHFGQFGTTTLDTARLDSMLDKAEFKDLSIVALLNILYAFL